MRDENRDLREIIREEMLIQDKIISVIREEPKTVPDIARELGFPPREVMFWVMGLRKYGHVTESGDATEEGYYRYMAVEKEDS